MCIHVSSFSRKFQKRRNQGVFEVNVMERNNSLIVTFQLWKCCQKSKIIKILFIINVFSTIINFAKKAHKLIRLSHFGDLNLSFLI